MLSRSINFLLSGDAHAPYLVVALRSLRRHYRDRITAWAYPESWETVKRIAADPSLQVEAQLWEPTYRGKNGQFSEKILMMQKSSTDLKMYLDADLIINGSLDPLFALAHDSGFVATQFCDWVTNTGTIKKRLSSLVGREGIDQAPLKDLLHKEYPSVNGGVFVCQKGTEILPEWYEATKKVIDLFIADETVLHTYQNNRHGNFTVAGGGSWNCSPKYKPAYLADCDVRIWHGHGDSFVRQNKSPVGVAMWMPEYQACLEENTGNIQEWNAAAVQQNKHLKTLLETACPKQ